MIICVFEVCTVITDWNSKVLLADRDANPNHAQNKSLRKYSIIQPRWKSRDGKQDYVRMYKLRVHESDVTAPSLHITTSNQAKVS